MNKSLWVVVAAWNEGKKIREVVGKLLEQYQNVVVVDDGSQDDTWLEAHEAGAWVLRHPVNLGQGAALQTGLTFSIRSGAEFVATFDADGQHDVADLGRFLDAIQSRNLEVAIGSRFLGTATGMKPMRRFMLKAAVIFTRLTTRLDLTDTHNGLRVFTRAAAAQIAITQNRMAHASQILEQIAERNLRYAEVPNTIIYTEYSMAKGQKTSQFVRVFVDWLMGRIGG